MPKSPETEGSPRLMTVKEIADEHGVSRVSIHTYRRRGAFPQPVEGEGTTRLRFRADEVAAFFAANPKQPGKRTDRAPKPQPQGGPMSVQGEATAAPALQDEVLQRLYRSYGAKDVHTMSAAQKLLNSYRAAVLRKAATELAALLAEEQEAGAIVDRLAEMADEAEQGMEA